MGDPLTQRQHRVLQTIKHFVKDEGYTPSVREIGAAIDLAPATVQRALPSRPVARWAGTGAHMAGGAAPFVCIVACP